MGGGTAIAHSRARYAKTREEVEAQIGAMMGWAPPEFAGEDPAVAEGKRRAYKAMTDLGVPRDQALDLLARFGLGDVERQLAWLPQRRAKNPARFLAAAIEGGYDRPPATRRQSAEADRREQNGPSDQEPLPTENAPDSEDARGGEDSPAPDVSTTHRA